MKNHSPMEASRNKILIVFVMVLILIPICLFCKSSPENSTEYLKCVSEKLINDINEIDKSKKIRSTISGPFLSQEDVRSVELGLKYDGQDLHMGIIDCANKSKANETFEMYRKMYGGITGLKIEKNTIGEVYIYKYPECRGIFDSMFQRGNYVVYLMYYNECPNTKEEFEQRSMFTKEIARLADKQLLNNTGPCKKRR